MSADTPLEDFSALDDWAPTVPPWQPYRPAQRQHAPREAQWGQRFLPLQSVRYCSAARNCSPGTPQRANIDGLDGATDEPETDGDDDTVVGAGTGVEPKIFASARTLT